MMMVFKKILIEYRLSSMYTKIYLGFNTILYNSHLLKNFTEDLAEGDEQAQEREQTKLGVGGQSSDWRPPKITNIRMKKNNPSKKIYKSNSVDFRVS